ncbi:MAG: DUF434 domain-containing protein [Candidatus Aminicenantes bacterium]|nr:DUF434 domain-containing protein [Candidatus Aminicenantes bacterium]
MNGSDLFSRELLEAAEDYVGFLERGYPGKPLLQLVGNRYNLNRRQRHILFRGISTRNASERRRARLIEKVCGKKVLLDAYNVLFTVMNHLLGNPLFLSSDGILRDVGDTRGRIHDHERFQRAMELVCDWLTAQFPQAVVAVFDSPVSHSAEHAMAMKAYMQERNLGGDADLARSADHVIKQCDGDVIATSDSIIIDATDLPVVDIPRLVLESAFHPGFQDLSRHEGDVY